MVQLTRENFKTEVEQAEKPVVIDFYAVWCGPCRALAPVYEALAEAYGERIQFCKADIDEQEGLAQQFDILSVPTLVLLEDGEVSQRVSGLHTFEELVEILNLN